MENEPTRIEPEQPLDMAGLSNMINSFITPLAENDAAVKKRAIDADLEKHRLTVELRGKSGQRSYHLALALLLISGSTLGGLMFAGKYDLAVNVLWYLGGGISGYGAALARKHAE